jgi:hypothetical protein
MRQPVVLFSGGLASYMAAHAVTDPICLFTDTKTEDEDLYRFLAECVVAHPEWQIHSIADGRDVWQVFKDKRMIGNTRIDPCSAILKRNLARKWIEDRFGPDECEIVVGIDWTEAHRFARMGERWKPYTVTAPLTEPPFYTRQDMANKAAEFGIDPPRLYGMGFPHNNCGGFCVKAGQAHFLHLLAVMPERFAYHEAKEQEVRDYLGKDVAILRDRRGGTTSPMTLRTLRERAQAADPQLDLFEWGGCGCFES